MIGISGVHLSNSDAQRCIWDVQLRLTITLTTHKAINLLQTYTIITFIRRKRLDLPAARLCHVVFQRRPVMCVRVFYEGREMHVRTHTRIHTWMNKRERHRYIYSLGGMPWGSTIRHRPLLPPLLLAQAQVGPN